MNREYFYSRMKADGTSDYETYLKTQTLLSCQKDFTEFCNQDELQFQIVHQSLELWMKLLAATLLDIDEFIHQENTNRVLTLFGRVHQIQHMMLDQLSILKTMSPKEYQEIRHHLGRGSGSESPGFRTLLKMHAYLWDSFKTHYLDKHHLTLEQVYDSGYSHSDAYIIAEALVEYEQLFRSFRYHHLQLAGRMIGPGSKSLKGHSTSVLEAGLRAYCFPELWEIRDKMTSAWEAFSGGVTSTRNETEGIQQVPD